MSRYKYCKIVHLSDTLPLLRSVWCNCYLNWDAVHGWKTSEAIPALSVGRSATLTLG
jgi:hypothetical protein